MRLSNLFVVSLLGMTVLGTTSCSKEDPVRQEVVDPAKTSEFYVKGQVVSSDNNTPLSDVKVTLDGQTVTTDAQGAYQMTLTQAKAYSVTFAKEGYVNQTAEVNLTGAANRATLTVDAKLFAVSKNEVTVKIDEPVVVTNDENGTVATSEASAEIQANSVKEEVNVTVTLYEPTANTSVKEETVVAPRTETKALKNIVITTSKEVVLQEPMKLNFKNTSGNATNYLEQVNVYRKNVTRSADNFEKIGVATFDPETNNYSIEIAAGQVLSGEYSLRVDYKRSATGVVIGETIYEKKIDNSSNYKAIEYTHQFEASTGWEYTDKGAASADEMKLIEEIIVRENGKTGVSKVPYSILSKISGNNILFFTVKQTQNDITYEVKTNTADRTVKTRKYLSVDSNYINESADQHSGGSAQS